MPSSRKEVSRREFLAQGVRVTMGVLAAIVLNLPAAYGDVYNEITGISPNSAAQGTASLTVTTTPYSAYPIVDTGQVECYNNATAIACPVEGTAFYCQDAQYSRNQPAYQDNGDGTITDLNTGLMWQKSPDMDGNGIINYSDKMYYDDALANASSFNLAGYNDWRLPTIKELYSLIMFYGAEPNPNATSPGSAVPFIDTNYFDFGYGDLSAGERIIDAQYASSTIYVSTTMNGNRTMFGVNFADGRIKGYPTDYIPELGTTKKYYVLYVRGNTAYGINDFADNGNGTITDRATGLMWAQNDSGVGLNWQEALAWVQTKNAENYLSYNNWRLPNAKELHSIVDYTRSPATTNSAAIDPLFNCTQITNEASEADYPFYWTSTTHCSETPERGASAAYISFGKAMGYMAQHGGWIDVHGAGAQRSDPKSGNPADYPYGHGPQGDAIRIYNYVRLVRDVRCGEPGYVSALDGDLNADCYVDFPDFAKLGQGWQLTYTMSDLALIAENWLDCIDPDAPCNYVP